MCSAPFPSMKTAIADDGTAIHAALANANGERLARPITATTRPPSQMPEVKVGKGRNGPRSRLARAAGLDTDRHPGPPCSRTVIARAGARRGHAEREPEPARWP